MLQLVVVTLLGLSFVATQLPVVQIHRRRLLIELLLELWLALDFTESA